MVRFLPGSPGALLTVILQVAFFWIALLVSHRKMRFCLQFHGKAELFLSDHFDDVWAESIEGKCRVHTFKKYTQMDDLGPDDYYCRFEYKALTGAFSPDKVAV
jgi:hypothetical protein